ncbi:hypothetical protein MMC18_004242 [Xylographa bjoerkii]|nr:hypothetical protein [Xylographa bjoerkii]
MASPRVSQEAVARPEVEFEFAVAEADVVVAVPVLEDMTGLPDEVLVTTALDIAEEDAAVPIAVDVGAIVLVPVLGILILRVTPTLLHNCSAVDTVAEKRSYVSRRTCRDHDEFLLAKSAESQSCITTGKSPVIQELSSQKHV